MSAVVGFLIGALGYIFVANGWVRTGAFIFIVAAIIVTVLEMQR